MLGRRTWAVLFQVVGGSRVELDRWLVRMSEEENLGLVPVWELSVEGRRWRIDWIQRWVVSGTMRMLGMGMVVELHRSVERLSSAPYSNGTEL